MGILVATLCVSIFAGWSLLAPLHSAALAPGKVVVDGNLRSVEHFEGGIIAQLMVQDGDEVELGDMLIVMDDTQASAELEVTTDKLYAATALQARLQAQSSNSDRISLPPLIASTIEPRAIRAIHNQQQIFHASRTARNGETQLLEKKISQLSQQIVGVEAVISSKQVLAESLNDEIRDFSELLTRGYVDKQHLRGLKRDLARTMGEVAEAESRIAQHQMQIEESRLQIQQLDNRFHNDIADRLGEVQNLINELEEHIHTASDRLNRTRITAPVSGIVLGMSPTTIGEVVRPAENLLNIVPQSEDLLIQARVNPIDIDRVHSGQSADIRFSALSSATTPTMEGTVVSVSADALSSEREGISYYLARIKLSTADHDVLENITLVPGMPVEVLIKTGSHTLFQYLSQPIRDAFARSLIED